jgi:hypothetical protein
LARKKDTSCSSKFSSSAHVKINIQSKIKHS